MTRYLFTFLLMTMLLNVMLLVPDILFQDKNGGALPSILLSVAIGTVLSISFTKALLRFPGQGLPEIIVQYLKKWLYLPILTYLACMWFIAGALVVLLFSIMIRRFINPDIPNLSNAVLMLAVASYGASRSSRSIFYFTEVLLALNTPIILFILFKQISSTFFRWDEVFLVIDHSFKMPTWSSVSAATYVFIGYINFAIFNREFKGDYKVVFMWVIPILSLLVLCTSFFIPIGTLGIEGVTHYTFPWLATADAARMDYGFIERMFFVFMLLYYSLSILFTMVTWHIGIEILKSVVPIKLKKNKWTPVAILSFFFLVTCVAETWIDETNILNIFKIWLDIRFPSELFLVGLVYFFSRKKKKEKKNTKELVEQSA